jgi:hypothetical protein
MSKCTAPHLLLYLIVNAFFLIHVQANAAGYLFLHFYDNKEQIYGSLSKGGSALDHMMLNRGNPLLTSDVGTKGVRDHFIVSKPDQSQHWILSTDLNRRAAGGYNNAFESRSIVVWASRGPSLTDWNPPHLLPLVPPNFRVNCLLHESVDMLANYQPPYSKLGDPKQYGMRAPIISSSTGLLRNTLMIVIGEHLPITRSTC